MGSRGKGSGEGFPRVSLTDKERIGEDLLD